MAVAVAEVAAEARPGRSWSSTWGARRYKSGELKSESRRAPFATETIGQLCSTAWSSVYCRIQSGCLQTWASPYTRPYVDLDTDTIRFAPCLLRLISGSQLS